MDGVHTPCIHIYSDTGIPSVRTSIPRLICFIQAWWMAASRPRLPNTKLPMTIGNRLQFPSSPVTFCRFRPPAPPGRYHGVVLGD